MNVRQTFVSDIVGETKSAPEKTAVVVVDESYVLFGVTSAFAWRLNIASNPRFANNPSQSPEILQ